MSALRRLAAQCARGDEPMWVSFVVFVAMLATLYLLLFVALPALVPEVAA